MQNHTDMIINQKMLNKYVRKLSGASESTSFASSYLTDTSEDLQLIVFDFFE